MVDSRSNAKFPESVAELISAPSPNVESTCPLKWKYSATMLAFQAPAGDRCAKGPFVKWET